MTSQEFVLWLKGFTEGVHEYNVTPKQWDLLKEKLNQVKDNNINTLPFGVPNIIQQPAPILPPLDPYNPYKVYCGTTNPPMTITTTPNTQGYITTSNPIQFGATGSATINPSSITYGYPSGSAWSYTTHNLTR
jgi:hypothetical protein